jgi:hypothetical protein
MLSPKVEADVLFGFDDIELGADFITPGEEAFEDYILSPDRELEREHSPTYHSGASPARSPARSRPPVSPDRRLELTATVTSESELIMASAVAMLNESMGMLHAKAHNRNRSPSPSLPYVNTVPQQPNQLLAKSNDASLGGEDEGVIWPASALDLSAGAKLEEPVNQGRPANDGKNSDISWGLASGRRQSTLKKGTGKFLEALDSSLIPDLPSSSSKISSSGATPSPKALAPSPQRKKRSIPQPSPISIKSPVKESPKPARKLAQPTHLDFAIPAPPPAVFSLLPPRMCAVGVPGYARATVASIKRDFN